MTSRGVRRRHRGADAEGAARGCRWLEFALDPLPDLFAGPPGGVSVKVKDAMLKRRFTDAQIDVAYDYMTRTDHDVMGGVLGLATYGGRINTVAPDATASAQRELDSRYRLQRRLAGPADEAKNLAWVRAFYRELFADTGGVPVPGDAYDGAFINHPDTDLADPTLNTSGVPWHTLYYQGNYSRLQRVKARWDPRNVFRHALSVRAEVSGFGTFGTRDIGTSGLGREAISAEETSVAVEGSRPSPDVPMSRCPESRCSYGTTFGGGPSTLTSRPRRAGRRVIHALRRRPIVRWLGMIDVHELPRIAVDQREPGALHLHHDPVPFPERVQDVHHLELDVRPRVRHQGLRFLEAVPELSAQHVASHELLIPCHRLPGA